MKRLLPVPGPDDKVRAIQHGQRLFSRVGVTSVIDPALTPDAQRAYQQLWAEDGLRVRTNMTTILDMNVPLSLTLDELTARVEGLGPYSGLGDDMLRLGQLKLFVDENNVLDIAAFPPEVEAKIDEYVAKKIEQA